MPLPEGPKTIRLEPSSTVALKKRSRSACPSVGREWLDRGVLTPPVEAPPWRRFWPGTGRFHLVEVGVAWGGSLYMWRDYFGAKSSILGVDILPKCKRFENRAMGIEVAIGDQGRA